MDTFFGILNIGSASFAMSVGIHLLCKGNPTSLILIPMGTMGLAWGIWLMVKGGG